MAFDLVAVGDVSLGDYPLGAGGGVHAAFERLHTVHPTYPFEFTAPFFDGAAVVFGNLETVLSHHTLARWRATSLEMRGHPATAHRLAAAGFTLLNVANNHMMQHGEPAFQQTVESLRQHQIGVVGVASRTRDGCIPEVVSVNGVRVTVLGYAFERDKYSRGPVAYAFGPDCDIIRQVREAKERSDVVICSLHWGVEFVRHPSAPEEALGRQLVEAGADLILGHHPHVARRVERCGRGLIAYSLGNFVFDMTWSPWLRLGIVLRVRLTKHGVENHRLELVWIGDDYQPRPLAGVERTEWTSALRALDQRPEWVSSDVHYAREYARLVSENRYQSYGHFLRHWRDRRMAYSLQIAWRAVARKALSLFRESSSPPSEIVRV